MLRWNVVMAGVLLAACGSARGTGSLDDAGAVDGRGVDAGPSHVSVEGLDLARLRYGDYWRGDMRYGYTTGTRVLAGAWDAFDAGQRIHGSDSRALTPVEATELVDATGALPLRDAHDPNITCASDLDETSLRLSFADAGADLWLAEADSRTYCTAGPRPAPSTRCATSSKVWSL